MAMTMMMMMNVVIGMLRVMNVVMILIMFKISESQRAQLQKARCWKLEQRSRERPMEWRRNKSRSITKICQPTAEQFTQSLTHNTSNGASALKLALPLIYVVASQ